MDSLYDHTRYFEVQGKISTIKSVFPDYFSISYYYEFMKVNIRISRFEIYFAKFDLDGERLPQLYLELLDAYKKRFMP